jgi:subtilisin-like proprotein convertase family protein
VDIRLSTDGGFTYPIALSLNEPNDGSATISVPPGTTNTGRVMVKGSNNIFFDINNTNIIINAGLPNFTITLNPTSVSECNDGSVQTTVQVGSFMGFSDPVTLSLLNPPPGAVVTFVPQVVTPGSNSTLTISNLTGLFGNYTPTVRGTSTTGNKDAIFSVTLLAPPTTPPGLLSPANNTPDADITPLLDWQAVAGATQYEYQVAYDNMFTNIARSGTTLTDQYQITTPLLANQQYYWRIRANNSCGTGTWSAAFTFTTTYCFTLMSTDVPIAISASGTPTINSLLTIPIDMVINDVNVISLTGTHTWVNDLKFTLIAPDLTERLIWSQPCGNDDNFNINFDDEAAPGSWPCPPTDGLTYRPSNTLSFFDGKHSNGTWKMKVQDVANQDGGSLNSWGLRVCGDLVCQLSVNQTSGTGQGSLPAAISCAAAGDTIRLTSLLSNQTVNIGGSPILLNKNLVILAEGTGTNITGTGTRVFDMAAGVQVQFLDVTITAGTSMTGGAINNPGILTLKNVNIEKNPGVSGASLITNSPGAQLFVVGTVNINQ